jgi:hypothetical protein
MVAEVDYDTYFSSPAPYTYSSKPPGFQPCPEDFVDAK